MPLDARRDQREQYVRGQAEDDRREAHHDEAADYQPALADRAPIRPTATPADQAAHAHRRLDRRVVLGIRDYVAVERVSRIDDSERQRHADCSCATVLIKVFWISGLRCAGTASLRRAGW